MPDPNAQRLDDARRRRLARLKEKTAESTAQVQADLHKNGISVIGLVDWIVDNTIGSRRLDWIAVVNSVPFPYVEVEIDRKIIERRPITCNTDQNNYAITRNVMNLYTAEPFFVLENMVRSVLGQPLKKWGE